MSDTFFLSRGRVGECQRGLLLLGPTRCLCCRQDTASHACETRVRQQQGERERRRGRERERERREWLECLPFGFRQTRTVSENVGIGGPSSVSCLDEKGVMLEKLREMHPEEGGSNSTHSCLM